MKAHDESEVFVRLGCGGLLGLVLGGAYAFYNTETALGFAACLAVYVAVCALGAWRFGDRFWHGMRHLFSFWYHR